jgi:hypothetical protein
MAEHKVVDVHNKVPLPGPEPGLRISAKVVREVIRKWKNWKHEEYWQYIHG